MPRTRRLNGDRVVLLLGGYDKAPTAHDGKSSRHLRPPMSRCTVHRLWSWFPALGITLGRHVFIREPGSELILQHELVHVRQQAEHPVWFWVSYLLLLPLGWNPWRMRWEAEAYAVQVRAGSSVESVARLIAGPLYGWCCRRKAAAEAVRRFL